MRSRPSMIAIKLQMAFSSLLINGTTTRLPARRSASYQVKQLTWHHFSAGFGFYCFKDFFEDQ
jgi:hypothetical protein